MTVKVPDFVQAFNIAGVSAGNTSRTVMVEKFDYKVAGQVFTFAIHAAAVKHPEDTAAQMSADMVCSLWAEGVKACDVRGKLGGRLTLACICDGTYTRADAVAFAKGGLAALVLKHGAERVRSVFAAAGGRAPINGV